MEFFRQNIIPGEVIVQLLAFLIVFFTLKHLAWGPILKALESRRAKIKNDFDRNETMRGELESLKAEYAAQLHKIDEEARAKIQEAIEEGRKISRDIQEKARAESQATFEKTKENIGLEMAKARIQLRREIAGIALQVSEKILQEKLTGDKQQEKILSMIEDLDNTLEIQRGK